MDLLSRPAQRPAVFSLASREYDPVKMGYHSERKDSQGHLINPSTPCLKEETQCLNTAQIGNSNAGHEYGTELEPADKLALLEYLKILAPEPEYSRK